ncbi:MAG: hypothetical protein K1W31_03065 [Lachnospiraceae bacterium]
MRERKIVVAAFVMVALLVAGCGKSEDLTGKWVYTSDEFSETIELFSDGTGIMSGINENDEEYKHDCTWIAENGRIKFTIDFGLLGDQAIAYDYKWNDSELIFTSEDGEEGIYIKQ